MSLVKKREGEVGSFLTFLFWRHSIVALHSKSLEKSDLLRNETTAVRMRDADYICLKTELSSTELISRIARAEARRQIS